MRQEMTAFKRYLDEQGYAVATKERMKRTIERFIVEQEKRNIEYQSLKEEEAKTYIKAMKERGMKRTSIVKEISILRLFYKGMGIKSPFRDYDAMLGLRKKEPVKILLNLEWYLKTLRSMNRAKATISAAVYTLRPFLGYVEEKGVKEISLIRRSDIEEYLEHVYANKNYSTKYKKLIIYFIGDYFKHASERGLVIVNPARKIATPRFEKVLPRDIPTDREVKKIISGIPKGKVRDRAIIEVLYGSGLRTNEITALKMNDIDYERQSIKVTDKKNRTERVVPFNDITGYVIKEYVESMRNKHIECMVGKSPNYDKQRAEEESKIYLFVSNGGLRISLSMIRTIVKKHVVNAGIKKNITPRSFRHACACEMLKNGAGIRWIQKMLGHEDINTTMIYTKIGIEDLKKIVDRMHPHGIPQDVTD